MKNFKTLGPGTPITRDAGPIETMIHILGTIVVLSNFYILFS